MLKDSCEFRGHKNNGSYGKAENHHSENSMRQAIEMLFNRSLKRYISFDSVAFGGIWFLVGAYLVDVGEFDNISAPMGTLQGLSSCNPDLVRFGEGSDLYYPVLGIDTPVFENVRYASLCDVVFTKIEFDGAYQEEVENALQRMLDEYKENCCPEDEENCCNEDVFRKLYSPKANNFASLTAGILAVKNVKVLGRLGNVACLITMPGTLKNRIYFVRLDAVDFIM